MRQYKGIRRPHTIFSPATFISACILAVGLGVGVYYTGIRALSPGKLSAINYSGQSLGGVINHAAIGNNCSQCHTLFEGIKAELCEECHTQIAQDRVTPTTLHGRFPNATDCKACHLDHRGEDYDLNTVALAQFDHDLTNFTLIHHLADYDDEPLDCAGCHTEEGIFTTFITGCDTCHQKADSEFMTRHTAAYGSNCLDCHDGHDTMAEFDAAAHAQIFALTGAHLETACEDCHSVGKFKGIESECAACHLEPPMHAGIFSTDCATCHDTGAWLPAELRQHIFPLDHGDQGGLPCSDCHTATSYAAYTCTTCHKHSLDKVWQDHAGLSESFETLQACANCHSTGRTYEE